MSDATRIHKCSMEELTRVLVQHFDVREGTWGVYVEFGIAGTNLHVQDAGLVPAAMVPIMKVGIREFPAGTPLAVDAASALPKDEAPK